MRSRDELAIATLMLQGATQIIDGIQRGVAARGFTDVRPAHGFVFVCISRGNASVSDVASYLGVTKQAASKLIDYLVERRYVTRAAHPEDGRARLLKLTARGVACTEAAEAAAAETVRAWKTEVGSDALVSMRDALRTVVAESPIRPAW